MEHSEAVSLFEGRRDAWLAEDLDAYLGYFSQEVHFQGPSGRPVVGLDAYRALVRSSMEMVRPVSFEYHDIAVHGPNVFAEWTQSAKVRVDRRLLEWRGMSICEILGGQIAWWREYYDPSQLRLRADR